MITIRIMMNLSIMVMKQLQEHLSYIKMNHAPLKSKHLSTSAPAFSVPVRTWLTLVVFFELSKLSPKRPH